ncbi:Hypothetical predicted protein, partial [Pelobates cultripes]
DVRDLSTRTTSLEQQQEELASTQMDMSGHLRALQNQMEQMEARVADQEDRARRNNLRLRGVPETILPDDLPAYVHGLLNAYAPDVRTDMLLVNRAHRVSKPKHIPEATSRDDLMRIHYYHIKETILRKHRSKAHSAYY